MESNISAEDEKVLREIVRQNDPYQEDDPALTTLDGDADLGRLLSSLAKKALDGKI